MLTRMMLDEVQAEVSQIEQLLEALMIIVEDVDESSEGRKRKQLDALIGVATATCRQASRAQASFEVLFDAMASGNGAAA